MHCDSFYFILTNLTLLDRLICVGFCTLLRACVKPEIPNRIKTWNLRVSRNLQVAKQSKLKTFRPNLILHEHILLPVYWYEPMPLQKYIFPLQLQGLAVPCVHQLLSSWGSPAERPVLMGLAYSGMSFGYASSSPFASVFCSSFEDGWPWIFHVSGQRDQSNSFRWQI
jgi:hypothetical protein